MGMRAGNVLWNFVGTVLPLIAGLVAVPLLVHGLGVERFGILSLAWMAMGYFSLFDLGIGRALTHVLSERLGRGFDSEIPDLAGSGIMLAVLLGLAGAAAAAMFGPWLARNVLHVPVSLYSDTQQTLYLLACSIPFTISTAGLRGILEAYQRFNLSNAIGIPLGVFTFIGPLVSLSSHRLAPGIAVLVLVRVIAWAAYLSSCLWIVPDLLKNLKLKQDCLKTLLSFGGWITISNVIGPLMVYLDRFLIGGLLSVSSVAYYTTPYDLATRLWVVPAAIVGVMFPAASASFMPDSSRTVRFYSQTAKYVFILLFPAVLAMITFAKQGLAWWLDPVFASRSALILQLLCTAVFINSLAQVAYALVQATGRADITAKLHMIELPFYLLLLWFLLESFGIEGAAIAWMVRVAMDSLLLFRFANVLIPGANRVTSRLLSGLLAAIAVFVIMGQAGSMILKLTGFSLVSLTFLGLTWFRLIGKNEKGVILQLMNSPKST